MTHDQQDLENPSRRSLCSSRGGGAHAVTLSDCSANSCDLAPCDYNATTDTLICYAKDVCSGTDFVDGSLVRNASSNATGWTLTLDCNDDGEDQCCEIVEDTAGEVVRIGLEGTDQDDVLYLANNTGGSAPNMGLISGGSSNLEGWLYGGGGDDRLYGSDSQEGGYREHLSGDDDDDIIHGNHGDDVIRGHAGNDELYGEQGVDSIDGYGGSDLIFGGTGDDLLHGGDGNDCITGGGGIDTIRGQDGDDYLCGDVGDSTVSPKVCFFDSAFSWDCSGTESFSGADTIYGTAGEDRIKGQGGNDTLIGNGDDDIICDDDDDTIDAGAGNDDVYHTSPLSLTCGTGSLDASNATSPPADCENVLTGTCPID